MAGRPWLFVALFVVAAGPAAVLVAFGAVDTIAELLFVLLVGTVAFFVGVVSQLRGPAGQ